MKRAHEIWERILGFPIGTYVKFRFENESSWTYGYVCSRGYGEIRFFVRPRWGTYAGISVPIFPRDEVHWVGRRT